MTPNTGNRSDNPHDTTDPFDDAPVIFSYTRKQAIEDGVLINLTTWARETGYVFPVACTAAVWNQCVVPPEGTRELGQSERGRAHDLLWMMLIAIRLCQTLDHLLFDVIFLDRDHRRHTVQLKVVCGSGDDNKPVLTVMLPTED